MGLRSVGWNLDTMDWAYADNDPTKMFNDFYANLDYIKPSGIIQLQHDLLQGSVTAVTRFIAGARSRGYTVSGAVPVGSQLPAPPVVGVRSPQLRQSIHPVADTHRR